LWRKEIMNLITAGRDMPVPAGRYPAEVAVLNNIQTVSEYNRFTSNLPDEAFLALEDELSRSWKRIEATQNLTTLLKGNL
jgi:hypothetical protein